ncbi:hypothetical protein Hanom_Chr11g01037411 [Helianthus anomalus]
MNHRFQPSSRSSWWWCLMMKKKVAPFNKYRGVMVISQKVKWFLAPISICGAHRSSKESVVHTLHK